MRIKHLLVGVVWSVILAAGASSAAWAQTAQTTKPAKELYERAMAEDEALRSAVAAGDRSPALREFRIVVAAYELVVRRYPKSGYSDNALFKGASLSRLAFERFNDAQDKRTAVRMLKTLVEQYPTSSLVRGSRVELDRLDPAQQLATPLPHSPATLGAPPSTASSEPAPAKPSSKAAETPAASSDVVVLRSITRTTLPGTVRISMELDREILFDQARIENPSRVFVDLKGTTPAPKLVDAVLNYSEAFVKQVRVGRHPGKTTRVVLDAEGVARYSVYTLYQPFRLVIDCERTAASAAVPPPRPAYTPLSAPAAGGGEPRNPGTPTPVLTARAINVGRTSLPAIRARAIDLPPEEPPKAVAETKETPKETQAPIPSRTAAAPVAASTAPKSNRAGGYSISRQLGLGVSRIVIDPGHGGHDPGAKHSGLTEAAIVLDISQRLTKLLKKEPGVEVVLTREKNVFIPLEQRTAIANKENADLFVSIHVNANASAGARGIETFFLNFATNPEAEAVAARENQGSGQAMHNLNDIVKAIALNNKLDESRGLATLVQDSMVKKVKPSNKNVRDLGVKQAPFVVLIGASMPSILAEVSFITNRQESQLLKTAAYRQKLAEALFEGIRRYQRSLKSPQTTAAQTSGIRD